jgi:hypothetical protein
MVKCLKDVPALIFRNNNLVFGLWTFIFLFTGLNANGQQISGIVFDSIANAPIPYATIRIKGTTKGVMSDLDGSFTLQLNSSDPHIIVINSLGYHSQEIEVKSNNSTPFNILLVENVTALEALIIIPDDTYSDKLLKKVIKNKSLNDPDKIKAFSFEEYTRTSAFLLDLDIEILNKKIFNKSKEAFVKTSDSTVMMPFFLSETLKLKTKLNKVTEYLIAENTEIVVEELKNQVKTVLTTKLTTQVNFYNNQIVIMDRGFPSPLSNQSSLFYNIYLSDSSMVNGIKHYKFDFFPKDYDNITFKGSFWVEDSSFALTKIKASLPPSANINFVNKFEVDVVYKKNEGTDTWFYERQILDLNLSILERKENQKKNYFSVKSIIEVKDIVIGKIDSQKIDSAISNNSEHNSKVLFNQASRSPLDSTEVLALEGIQCLKKNPIVKQVDLFGNMFLTGYYNVGKIDIGPFYDFYRKNAIEGARVTLPFRTSKKMFENVSIGGHLGYGFKNHKFKYGAKINYLLPTDKRTVLSFNYDFDYSPITVNNFNQFIQENPFSNGNGNLFTTITSTPNPNILLHSTVSLNLEHQLNENVGLFLMPFNRTYFQNEFLKFEKGANSYAYFINNGVLLDFRFSFGQKYDEEYFSRIYYGSQKPVVHIGLEVGKTSFANYNAYNTFSEYGYAHLHSSIKYKYKIGPVNLRFMADGGKIWGNVPYPLLQMPQGTEALGFSRYHFNLLRHVSFADDIYTNVHVSLNGGGILFNKIPGLSNLNIREAISFKAHYGRRLNNFESIIEVPQNIYNSPKLPYMEVGFGISNIFKVIRIEYITRINNGINLNQFSSKSGIRIRAEVTF